MTITYELGNSLYVNITNRCSNACEFCLRSKHDNVNGEDDLWLEREPTIDEIKARIRVNTNGQANLINGRDVTPELRGAIDIVSISLNAPTAEAYQKICHSRYGEGAFAALQEFAKKAKPYVKDVVFSVVDKTMPDSDIEMCRRIAESIGVTFRVREYIE